jgi:hypothetical protein
MYVSACAFPSSSDHGTSPPQKYPGFRHFTSVDRCLPDNTLVLVRFEVAREAALLRVEDGQVRFGIVQAPDFAVDVVVGIDGIEYAGVTPEINEAARHARAIGAALVLRSVP